MATLVLGAVGSAIGGAFGGAILGFSGAAIGGFIGSTIGSVIDNWIVSSLAPAQRIEGARLDSLRRSGGLSALVTHDPGGTWPDSKGEALAMAVLAHEIGHVADQMTRYGMVKLDRSEGKNRLNLLGRVGGMYVVLETADGLVLMDPRSAHERVIYERLLGAMEQGIEDARRAGEALVGGRVEHQRRAAPLGHLAQQAA